ncbi:MAG TPA: ATP-binding cassette domain-containing protein [Polyangiaceae bacterium]|nr:ATP-binding cassette domain-containing protein [Polyangiaceae bacterium]
MSDVARTVGLGVPAIETHALTRRFGDFVAVDALDLNVTAGTFFGLLGSNGAGKSTAIKMLTTLLPATAGSAKVAGFDVWRDARQVRRHIGYVPQLISADSALTARENLSLFAKLYGIQSRERGDRIDEALEFMGLSDVSNALVRTYSGGMIRRLEIAQALLHRPAVVFLDEPTVGLDPNARHSVWERLRELRVRFGTTVLLTTHDMEEAEALCDLVTIMHRGRVVAAGSPAQLKARAGSGASMDDVFIKFTQGVIDEHGRYRDTAQARQTTQRLG